MLILKSLVVYRLPLIKYRQMSKKTLKNKNIIHLLSIIFTVILINYIVSFLVLRIDLTTEGRYTLSEHTKHLLENLDEPIYIKIYLEGDDIPLRFKQLRTALKDLLEEFKYYSGNDFDFRFINPTANPDKKAKFGLWKELGQKGIKPVESEEVSDEGNTSRKLIFPGAVIIYKGKELGVNLLKSDQADSDQNIKNSIQSLEYELTNAIRKLSLTKKQEIAFIEGHGELNEMEVMDISTALSEYYDVKRGAINATPGILDRFSVVIIANPTRKFSEDDKLVLDQYIMKGGKVLLMINGVNVSLDSLRSSPITVAMPYESGLDEQLFRYGVRLNPGLLRDVRCGVIGLAKQTGNGQTKIIRYPWTYYPIILSGNTHTVNKYMNLLKTEFPTTLDTVASSPDVRKTVLFSSSDKSKFNYAPTEVSFMNISRKINPAGFTQRHLPVAVLLEGEFDSNFKNRLLQKLIIPRKDIIPKSKPTKMIVVADGSIARNLVSNKGEIYPIGFDMNLRHIYKGNKEFILNAVNYLSDDEGFMEIRLREIKMRLLNKDLVNKHKLLWKTINVLLPILLLIVFGLLITFIRKQKYTRM